MRVGIKRCIHRENTKDERRGRENVKEGSVKRSKENMKWRKEGSVVYF